MQVRNKNRNFHCSDYIATTFGVTGPQPSHWGRHLSDSELAVEHIAKERPSSINNSMRVSSLACTDQIPASLVKLPYEGSTESRP
ncbi:hypothetical protein VTK26DRAFT_1650 [Humicola hyalothermophila]